MTVFVISGASYGIGPELVRQISSDNRNTVFVIVQSAHSAVRLTNWTSAHENTRIYFEGEQDGKAGLEVIARDIAKCVGKIDVLINNVACLEDYLAADQLSPDENRLNPINGPQQFVSTHILSTINTTNTFLPLLQRGTSTKIVTVSPEYESVRHYPVTLSSGLDAGVAYAMAKAALSMSAKRSSTLPELKQNRITCASIEYSILDVLPDQDDHYIHITNTVEEILRTVSQVKPEDSGSCIQLWGERDLITL